MAEAENIKRLKDFVERADLIRSYSYLVDVENVLSTKINSEGGKLVIEFSQPNKEKTDALLFNLRLFVQNKDDISIGRLEELCTDPTISQEWKNEYRGIRNGLNGFLQIRALEDKVNGNLTYDELFRMVLFGGLSHRSENDGQYQQLRKWTSSQAEWDLIYNVFHQVVLWIVAAVTNISAASKEELERISLSKNK